MTEEIPSLACPKCGSRMSKNILEDPRDGLPWIKATCLKCGYRIPPIQRK